MAVTRIRRKGSKWVFDWMSGHGRPAKAELPYHLRRYMKNSSNVPTGHFSILVEMTQVLIGPWKCWATRCRKICCPIFQRAKCFASGCAINTVSTRMLFLPIFMISRTAGAYQPRHILTTYLGRSGSISGKNGFLFMRRNISGPMALGSPKGSAGGKCAFVHNFERLLR
jgi:hypothetical protein